MRAFLRCLAVTGLAAALSACGGDQSTKVVPASTNAPATTATTTPTTAATTTAPTSVTTTPPITTAPAQLADVKVYFMRDERLVIAHRQVAGPAVLRGALTALFEGPTPAERSAGMSTAVPAGTALVDVALANGLATVDLSRPYESGGGSLSMQSRVAQVVFTVTQFDNVEKVTFRLEGTPLLVLGGEGLSLAEPQTRSTVPRSFSGGVIIDSPAPGATVRSPITVTGEGDVYESQFPIEVWVGDRQVGGVAPVTAGAWGTWRSFTVAVPVSAEPGPIRLVAYDEGGCGSAPDCPPIVKTEVPLVFAR